MKLTILGQIKSGKNNMRMTRTGKHYPNPEWAKWRNNVLDQIKEQNIGQWEKFDAPCRVTVRYWKGDLRRRDVPGMIDALWHCFERSGIVSDDKWFEHVEWIPMGIDDNDNPRVEVEINLIPPF